MCRLDRFLPGFATAALAAPALAGNVITVGPSGADYVEIAPAVAAAADDDVILVRAGTYGGFVIDGKSIRVVADTGAAVVVQRKVVVQNLAAGGSVVLSGLDMHAHGAAYDCSLLVTGNAGSVRIVGCEIGLAYLPHEHSLQAGARIVVSTDVAFSGCALQGADAVPVFTPGNGLRGGDGLEIEGSQVSLHDCQCTGGTGGLAYDGWTGGAGGDGCAISGSMVHASGTSFHGGAGANGNDQATCIDIAAGDGGDGGDAIRADAQSTIVLLDPMLAAGAFGRGGYGACGPNGVDGAPGATLDLAAGTQLTQLPGIARRMSLAVPVRETVPVAVSFTGEPGDIVRLTVWDRAGFLYMPAYFGVFLEHAPLVRRIQIGTIPPSGVLQANIVFPALPAGVEAKTFFLQPYFVDSANSVRLGSSIAEVVLDSAF
ncbi:MAG TPA: hypothetical protein VGR31_10430 [Planctomycetota bacterium]|jgi:hypothetical protein|nr:hypothetical protein [Planctomycetota bacterium]